MSDPLSRLRSLSAELRAKLDRGDWPSPTTLRKHTAALDVEIAQLEEQKAVCDCGRPLTQCFSCFQDEVSPLIDPKEIPSRVTDRTAALGESDHAKAATRDTRKESEKRQATTEEHALAHRIASRLFSTFDGRADRLELKKGRSLSHETAHGGWGFEPCTREIERELMDSSPSSSCAQCAEFAQQIEALSTAINPSRSLHGDTRALAALAMAHRGDSEAVDEREDYGEIRTLKHQIEQLQKEAKR